jgi:hypothetical protein
MDYDGEMGVPITFLDRYNPAQFEIVGYSRWLAEPMSSSAAKEDYMSANGKIVGGTGKFFLPLSGGKHAGVYQRIVIRRIGGSGSMPCRPSSTSTISSARTAHSADSHPRSSSTTSVVTTSGRAHPGPARSLRL